jgi:adenylyltransferase/sulfurtransferase
MRFRQLKLRKNPGCPVCGTHRTITKLIDYEQFCGIAPPAPSNVQEVKNGVPQITVQQLKKRIDAGEGVYILDVREPFEYKIANLGGQLIPLGEVAQRLSEIDRNREVVVQCKGGVRSQKAAEVLKQNGFEHVINLAGGIIAWATEIDPTMKKY